MVRKLFLILNLALIFGCADFDFSQVGADSEVYEYNSRQDNSDDVVRLPFFINNEWSLVELSRSAQQPSVVWAEQLQVSLASQEDTINFDQGLHKITYQGEDFYLKLTPCPTVNFSASIVDIGNGTLGLLNDDGTVENSFVCKEEPPQEGSLLDFPHLYIGDEQENGRFSLSLAMDASIQKGLFALERFSGDYFTSQRGSWESVRAEESASISLGNDYYFNLPRKIASYRLRVVAADAFDQIPEQPFTYYFYTITEEDRQSVRLAFKDDIYLLSEVNTLSNGDGKRIPDQAVNKSLQQRFSYGEDFQILTRMEPTAGIEVRAYQEQDGGIFSNDISEDVVNRSSLPLLSGNNLYRHIWNFQPQERERYLITVDYTTSSLQQKSFGFIVPEDTIPRWTSIERLSRERTVELLEETGNFPTDRSLTNSNYSSLSEVTGNRTEVACNREEELKCVLDLTPSTSATAIQDVNVQGVVKRAQGTASAQNYYAGLRLWVSDAKAIRGEQMDLSLEEIKRGSTVLTQTTVTGRETYWVTQQGEQLYEGGAALKYIDVALYINNTFSGLGEIALKFEAKDRFAREVIGDKGKAILSLEISSE